MELFDASALRDGPLPFARASENVQQQLIREVGLVQA